MRPDFYVLSWNDLLVSLLFIAFSLFLIKKWKLGLENTLLIGTVRTFVQLTLMGYVLTWFFWSGTLGIYARFALYHDSDCQL